MLIHLHVGGGTGMLFVIVLITSPVSFFGVCVCRHLNSDIRKGETRDEAHHTSQPEIEYWVNEHDDQVLTSGE